MISCHAYKVQLLVHRCHELMHDVISVSVGHLPYLVPSGEDGHLEGACEGGDENPDAWGHPSREDQHYAEVLRRY